MRVSAYLQDSQSALLLGVTAMGIAKLVALYAANLVVFTGVAEAIAGSSAALQLGSFAGSLDA